MRTFSYSISFKNAFSPVRTDLAPAYTLGPQWPVFNVTRSNLAPSLLLRDSNCIPCQQIELLNLNGFKNFSWSSPNVLMLRKPNALSYARENGYNPSELSYKSVGTSSKIVPSYTPDKSIGLVTLPRRPRLEPVSAANVSSSET